MNISSIKKVILIFPLCFFYQSSILAADSVNTQEKIQVQTQEQVDGRQLMTGQERTEFRSKIRAAKTSGERELIRTENHNRMKERAKEQGVTLSDEKPSKGGGIGLRNDMKNMGNRMGGGNRGRGR